MSQWSVTHSNHSQNSQFILTSLSKWLDFHQLLFPVQGLPKSSQCPSMIAEGILQSLPYKAFSQIGTISTYDMDGLRYQRWQMQPTCYTLPYQESDLCSASSATVSSLRYHMP